MNDTLTFPSAHPSRYVLMPDTDGAALESFRHERAIPLISRSTRITSIGSCFADNIRIHLKSHDYNYLTLEPSCGGQSANWGRVYNAGQLEQIVRYSTGEPFAPRRRWLTLRSGAVWDPYRAIADYPDEVTADASFAQHVTYSAQAIREAEVIIMTLGLIESWRFVDDGMYLHGRPPEEHAPLCQFVSMGYTEVSERLRTIWGLVKRVNPGATGIFTVSPVPLRATFRTDVGTVSASAYSKAVLLAAVHAFCMQTEGVHYFPSYELVRDVLRAPLGPQGNYSADVLSTVMSLFDARFVAA